MKTIIAIVLYYIGIILNRKKMRILSLYYHHPSPEVFEKMIKWAIKRRYTFLSRQDFLAWFSGNLEIKSKAIYFSFDDGWKDNMLLIPILEKYNVPITIFVPVLPLIEGNYWWEYVLKKHKSYYYVNKIKDYDYKDFVVEINHLKKNIILERSAMTFDELNTISHHPLVDIQSHSYSHPILTKLPQDILSRELKQSKSYLEKFLDKEINTFSYPNGSLSEREISAVGEDYKFAFTTEQAYPKVGGNPLTIPRIAQTNDYWSNLAKIAGTWIWLRKK